MAASKLHKHRAHVTLLSGPTVYSLYCGQNQSRSQSMPVRGLVVAMDRTSDSAMKKGRLIMSPA